MLDGLRRRLAIAIAPAKTRAAVRRRARARREAGRMVSAPGGGASSSAPVSPRVGSLREYSSGRAHSTDRPFVDQLASWVSEDVDASVDPACVPFSTLRRLDRDPVCYLGEWAITGLLRKRDLYYVSHPQNDRKLIAETEEWLWPLLDAFLGAIARAFVFGSVPYVGTWAREDLRFYVPPKAGKGKPRLATIPDHWHYTALDDLRPDCVEVWSDPANARRLARLAYEGSSYDRDRAGVVIWDRQWGEWTGQGARRRAWMYHLKGRVFDQLQARYLERTVHTPVIVYAPDEKVDKDASTLDGQETIGDLIAELVAEDLYGGGAMTLPDDRTDDGKGERRYGVEPLELPERSEVFDRALNRFDSQKLASYLLPPALGMEDGLGAGASRGLSDLMGTFLEALVGFAAGELTGVVSAVHRANHETSKKPVPCEIGCREPTDKVAKRMLEVLRLVADRAEVGGRVDVDELLNYLGVPISKDDDGQGEGDGKGQPGRPRDFAGKREERREDATTPEGEDDTGEPREEE